MRIKEITLENYRSYEDCTIEFEDYYTAICGKNNSGKSNILQGILTTLGYPQFGPRINYNTDFPVWKKKEKQEKITLTIKIQLDRNADVGLIRFLKLILHEDSSRENLEIKDTLLLIKMQYGSSLRETEAQVMVDNKDVPDKYKVDEILRRIRFAQVIVFHNSTQVYRKRFSHHGYLEGIAVDAKDSIETKLVQINTELNKVVQKHKSQLQELIGRLQEKYEVHLTFSGFDMDFERIPYEISLGEKDFDIPLDEWGSGTRNRTLILNSIFNAKNLIEQDDDSNKITPVVILEEPESFLHPSAQAEFGRVLQDLSQELEIQVITTTHSPYLLSHNNPKSNILVKRNVVNEKVRESIIQKVEEKNWIEPFQLALGMIGPEFDSLKEAFFSKENNIILLEGKTDVEYFKILQDNRHGDKKLFFKGELYAYSGYGFLNNVVLLKFIKERFNNLIVTFDLDILSKIESNFERAGYEKDKDYFPIGLDKPGYRSIEGLLPSFIKENVNNTNPELVFQLQSDDTEERNSAHNRLKSLYLQEFKKDIKFNNDYFSEFYKLTEKVNKIFKN